MNEDRNNNQRLHFHVADDPVVFLADFIQGFRRFVGCKGSKQSFRMTVGVGRADIILHVLCLSRQGVSASELLKHSTP